MAAPTPTPTPELLTQALAALRAAKARAPELDVDAAVERLSAFVEAAPPKVRFGALASMLCEGLGVRPAAIVGIYKFRVASCFVHEARLIVVVETDGEYELSILEMVDDGFVPVISAAAVPWAFEGAWRVHAMRTTSKGTLVLTMFRPFAPMGGGPRFAEKQTLELSLELHRMERATATVEPLPPTNGMCTTANARTTSLLTAGGRDYFVRRTEDGAHVEVDVVGKEAPLRVAVDPESPTCTCCLFANGAMAVEQDSRVAFVDTLRSETLKSTTIEGARWGCRFGLADGDSSLAAYLIRNEAALYLAELDREGAWTFRTVPWPPTKLGLDERSDVVFASGSWAAWYTKDTRYSDTEGSVLRVVRTRPACLAADAPPTLTA